MAEAPELWEHQKAAIARAASGDYYGLFFEQGCGKTRTLIEIYTAKCKREGRPLRALILCPPIVVHNWGDEMQRFCTVNVATVALVGTAQERLERITSAPRDVVFVCNYQTLLMPACFQALKAAGIEVLVLDESHKIKTYNSKTTKAALKLANTARFRYCLSGTPVLNSFFDIWPQATLLDGGKALGHTFFAFRHRFFHDENEGRPKNCYFPKWKPQEGAITQIKEIMAGFSTRVFKKDCLDLPPLIRQKIYVPLDERQERVYRDLEKHMVAAIGDSMIVSDMAMTNILRMQQLVSGFAMDTSGRVMSLENPRMEALIETLDSIGPKAKVIIWCVWKENYWAIRKRLMEEKIRYTEITGEINACLRPAKIKMFKEDPECNVLIANPKAAGTGINLTEASYSIYFSRDYSLENDLQSEARNYRAGSERHEKVTRIDLVAPNTIDEVILNALAAKQLLGEAILNHYHKDKLTNEH